MGTLQITSENDGKTNSAKRLFVNGQQVYPPLDGSNGLMFSENDGAVDFGEGQLHISIWGVGTTGTTSKPATTTAPETTTISTTTAPVATTVAPTTTIPVLSTSTTGPAPQNVCNACDPLLPDVLLVDLAGLAGDFAQFNDLIVFVPWRVPWASGCAWYLDLGFGGIALNYAGANTWRVAIATVGNCTKSWIITTDPCTPQGIYAEESCNSAGCTDTDSCADSAGATCVVSLP